MTPDDVESKQFKPGFRGYSVEQVDAFLDEVAAELRQRDEELQNAVGVRQQASPDPPPLPVPSDELTAGQVQAAEFGMSLRGYSVNEVDAFTKRVAEQLGRSDSERTRLAADNARLREQAASPPAPPADAAGDELQAALTRALAEYSVPGHLRSAAEAWLAARRS